jgi:hypothetical protein
MVVAWERSQCTRPAGFWQVGGLPVIYGCCVPEGGCDPFPMCQLRWRRAPVLSPPLCLGNCSKLLCRSHLTCAHHLDAVAEKCRHRSPNIYIYTYPTLSLVKVLKGGTERSYR